MTYESFKNQYGLALNDQQEAAVQAVDGQVLLLAVPGSGKTTTLVSRLGYMVLALGIPPENILTMTYTVAATEDMRRRFAALFGTETASRLEFRTINGVSARIIRSYEKLTGRNGEITLLKDQHKKELDESKQIISQREAQIEELKQLLEEEKLKKPTIEDGIRELIQKEFDQQFISRLTQAFAQAAKVLAPNTVDPTTDPEGRYTGMYNALLEMVVAECYAKSPTFEDCTPEVFKTQTAHFKADVRAIINHNIDDISSDIHSRSNMYTKLG